METSSCLATGFKTTPYWWEAAPPEAAVTALPPRADVVVVGSGYCGLSAATELARAGTDVVVIEAAELGFGASTRSGGMVTGGQKLVVSGAINSHAPERRRRMLEDAKDSLAHIEALIDRHGLDADYQKCGRLILASTPSHYRRLESWAKLLDAYAPGTIALVERQDLTTEIGGEHYFGGLRISNYGGLHPAKYHRALRNLAREAGARLIGGTPVGTITREGSAYVVATSRGDVRADAVFIATNGYSGAAEPFLEQRVVGAASYIIATEPLPAELTRRLSPNGRMFSDTKRSLAYFRLSPDGTRVVFGGRTSGREIEESRAAVGLYRQMCEVWPALAAYQVSHCWRGNVGMTSDHIPHMGTNGGVHYAVGCNGSGVAMMTYLGHQSALKMLGRQNRPCAFETDAFPRFPLAGLRKWTVPAVTRYYLARDWLDRRLAGRP
ncbi:MAG: FAD-binding oxidoreductase [Hyphomicrobiaceae bacterium]